MCHHLQTGARRANQLFVNQGAGNDGIPVFRDMAPEYGIADTSYSTNASFFDADNDGDLDLYVTVNMYDPQMGPNAYWWDNDARYLVNVDRFYINEYDSLRGHPVYRDATTEAGILKGGFSLGMHVVDIDRDGWKDVYISNDYNSPDMLFMNNGDGTFTDRAGDFMKHTCYSAMGMNVADMNNDGRADIFVLDMLPEDNLRRKAMLQPFNYISYVNNDRFGYTYQHVRNVLQMNQGVRPDNGDLSFLDVGLFAGIHATDWSWTPMLADFDNDQFRDLIITNGFPKDITDHDFSDYMTMRGNFIAPDVSLELIPSVKLYNYAYRNELDSAGGIPRFTTVSREWGITEPSFSSSAAYGDLDNDGDLDYVINNIDDSASVFRNMLVEQGRGRSNWLKVHFTGGSGNPDGLGAIVEIFYDGQEQMWENNPYRGYHSSVQTGAHFGLGEVSRLDSLRVEWPGGKTQTLRDVGVNADLRLDWAEATSVPLVRKPAPEPLFSERGAELGLDYLHPESDYIDYKVQRLLLHKLSQLGPGLAVSDVNGDGRDDLYLGGSHFHKGWFFLQQADGNFLEEGPAAGRGRRHQAGRRAGGVVF
ncbi:MAG: CRTAC1 family protein [Bacteroidales bacterium]